MKDYYKILEVDPESSDDEIKRSYYKLAFKYHPDRSDYTGSKSLFVELSEAYGVLSDPVKKKEYDHLRNGGTTETGLTNRNNSDIYRTPFDIQNIPEDPIEDQPTQPKEIVNLNSDYQKAIRYIIWSGLLLTSLLFFDFVLPNRASHEVVVERVEHSSLLIDVNADNIITDHGSILIVPIRVSDGIIKAKKVQVYKSMIFSRPRKISLNEWPYEVESIGKRHFLLMGITTLLFAFSAYGLRKNIQHKIEVFCGISVLILIIIALVVLVI